MNRLFWGIALMVIVATGSWGQSTWRGQAEVWSTNDAPADGFVAASNEFPKNSLLTVENYKSRKTIQVRVVSALPAGASALILLNSKAATALDIKGGEIPLVGVRMDPTGIDRADNPDPDVNPLAAGSGNLVPPVTGSGVPTAVPPVTPVATLTPAAAPTLAPEAKDTSARTPAASTLDATRGATTLDPDLLPLPSLAEPEPVAEPASALAVADEPAETSPVTPGRKVFVTSRDPEPVASESTPVTETPELVAPESEPETEAPIVEALAPDAPVAVAPEPSAPVEAAPDPTVVVAAPAVVPLAPAPAPVAPVPAKPAPATAWVPVPGKLEGPVLGSVPVLAGLEKGRSYVQVGAWASEADVLTALSQVKSYVPLALYKAEGEKNPWRVVVASAPKAQLGLLLMHYRSQGFRTAGVVKG